MSRDLSRFRVDGGDGTVRLGEVRPWTPTFQRVRILAFDQTLAHCGWVLFSVMLGEIDWRRSGVIEIGGDLTTMTGRIAASRTFHERLRDMRKDIGQFDMLVMESPVGNNLERNRSDSPILAASAIWSELRPRRHGVLIQANQMKNRWTNSSTASKMQVRLALEGLFPEFITAFETVGEHVADAIGLGLYAAEGKGKEII